MDGLQVPSTGVDGALKLSAFPRHLFVEVHLLVQPAFSPILTHATLQTKPRVTVSTSKHHDIALQEVSRQWTR